MTNHPNRNWRRHMHQAADQWLVSPAADRLATSLPVVQWGIHQQIRDLLREAYVAGYIDARKDDE